MEAFELHTDYIKKYKVKDGNRVVLEVIVEEDYDPRTDGYHVNLKNHLLNLSMPQDNDGTDCISTIIQSFQEACNSDHLKPGTIYDVWMVECEEKGGWPSMMKAWGIELVKEYALFDPKDKLPF